MGPMDLHFDFRDIFRSPRLALSGKKIWVMLLALLIGYIFYWVFAYISLAIAGITFGDAWAEYGLYPCLVGNDATWFPYVFWVIGLIGSLVAVILGSTAVARITYKQLKGDEFYSSSDAWKFVKKHWHAPVFTHLSIAIIALFFVVMAVIVALIGKIPYFGELFFGIPYLLWFFGSVFVAYTLVVLVISVFFTHAIVSTLEEDTMGAVFQNYSITWSQPWRIVIYLGLLCFLIYAGVTVFALFMKTGYDLINFVFGHGWLMDEKLANMVGWATSIVWEPLSPVVSSLNVINTSPVFFDVPESSATLEAIEYAGGFFVAISLFLITAIALSYGACMQVVGETIAVVVFKQKSDDDNLLERKDEEEFEAEEEMEVTPEEAPPAEKEEGTEEPSGEEEGEGEEEESGKEG